MRTTCFLSSLPMPFTLLAAYPTVIKSFQSSYASHRNSCPGVSRLSIRYFCARRSPPPGHHIFCHVRCCDSLANTWYLGRTDLIGLTRNRSRIFGHSRWRISGLASSFRSYVMFECSPYEQLRKENTSIHQSLRPTSVHIGRELSR